jgi:hypothetical protein
LHCKSSYLGSAVNLLVPYQLSQHLLKVCSCLSCVKTTSLFKLFQLSSNGLSSRCLISLPLNNNVLFSELMGFWT